MSVQPDMTDDQPRRRGYDHMPELEALEQRLLYAMGEKLSDTRHAMRNEFGASMTELAVSVRALTKEVEANTLQSTREHAAVQAAIGTLTVQVSELQRLVPRVEALESTERSEHAVAQALKDAAAQAERNAALVERNRVSNRNWAMGIIGTVVTAAGVILGFVS